MGIMTRIRIILLLLAKWSCRGYANILPLLIWLQVVRGMPYNEEEGNDYRDCAKCRRQDEAKVVECEGLP